MLVVPANVYLFHLNNFSISVHFLLSMQEHVWLLAIMNVATIIVGTVQAVLQTVFVTLSAVLVVIAVLISEIPALYRLIRAVLRAMRTAVIIDMDVLCI